MQRIGLFGGTFNPVHIGHISVSENLKAYFNLDKIIMIPAYIPPHKKSEEIADIDHRLAMLRIATKKHPFFSISEIEIDRKGVSYSIDTISYFKAKYDKKKLFFIIGYDAFIELHTWKSYEKLPETISFIVMPRRADSRFEPDKMIIDLNRYLKIDLGFGYEFDKSRSAYIHKKKKNIFFADIPSPNISSTQIRSCIKRDKDIGYMVTKEISDYIKEKGLYK